MVRVQITSKIQLSMAYVEAVLYSWRQRLILWLFSSGSFCQIERVTDEARIAESTVWPNFFLMYVFFALKGSKLLLLFISIFIHGLILACYFTELRQIKVQILQNSGY